MTVIAFDLLPMTGRLAPVGIRWEILLVDMCAASLATVAAYLRDANVRDRLRLSYRAIATVTRLRVLDRQLDRQSRQTRRLEEELGRSQAGSQQECATITAKHDARIHNVEEQLRTHLAQLKSLEADLQRRRSESLAAELDAARARQSQQMLREHSIFDPHLQLGITVRIRLWVSGVRTAADIDPGRAAALNRLPPADAAKLLAWRETLRRPSLTTLPNDVVDRVAAPFHRRLEVVSRLRESSLRNAAPVLTMLREWRDFEAGAVSSRAGLLDASISHELEEAERHRENLAKRQASAMRELDVVDGTLERYRRLTFSRFLAFVILGRRPLPF
jgi:outer membrane murein-binding lipoprotein Lpp